MPGSSANALSYSCTDSSSRPTRATTVARLINRATGALSVDRTTALSYASIAAANCRSKYRSWPSVCQG
jgi:hypothetical protein